MIKRVCVMVSPRRNRREHGGIEAMLALAIFTAPRVARAQSPGVEALGVGLVADLAAPLNASVPEAFGDRSAVGVRITGAAPREVLDGVARGLERALTAHGRAVTLSEGDDVAGASRAARAASAPRLLRVEVFAGEGVTRAHAELYVVDPGPWRTFLASEPPPPERVGTSQRDVTTAAAHPQAPRWPAPGRPRVVATPFRGTVALSLADLDGDGRDELVIVTAERVRVARMAGATLAFVRDAPGSAGALSRAPVPLRQALGAADRDAARRVVRFRTSHHTAMGEVRLTDGATHVRSLDVDLYPAGGFGCVALRPGTGLVAGFAAACDATPPLAAQGSVSAIPVALDHSRADGLRVRWEVRATGAGAAEVRRDGMAFATLDDVASPVVLDDLDGDGRVELLAASASAPGAADRVRVFSLGDRADERPSIPVPGAIEAMATGDLDGDGRRELVVSVLDPSRRASTVWIIP